jgi:hypothetical protein
MDPYLEQPEAWHDFHNALCSAIREAIVPQVRPRYFVKLEEHVYLHELSADERRLAGRGDVTVAIDSRADTAIRAGGTALSASAYGSVRLAVDEERVDFLEILDRQTRDVVTVIELLSPSNKDSSQDRSQYLGKRERVLESSAHFVELDLLRGGRRPPIDDQPECDYCVMVSRAEMRPRVELWPFRLRDRLPRVPVPLRSPDPDAVLDLQSVFDRVYDATGYEDYIYAGKPSPPLTADDDSWAAMLLSERTSR